MICIAHTRHTHAAHRIQSFRTMPTCVCVFAFVCVNTYAPTHQHICRIDSSNTRGPRFGLDIPVRYNWRAYSRRGSPSILGAVADDVVGVHIFMCNCRRVRARSPTTIARKKTAPRLLPHFNAVHTICTCCSGLPAHSYARRTNANQFMYILYAPIIHSCMH